MFAVDVRDDAVVTWKTTATGAVAERHPDYTPTIYVAVAAEGTAGASAGPALAEVRSRLADHATVADTAIERWRTRFRRDPEPVVRVDVDHPHHVRRVASAARELGPAGSVRPHNVDLAPEFRYCLETGASPVPGRELRTLSLSAPALELRELPVTELAVDDERVSGSARAVAEHLRDRLAAVDPDVLVVDTGALVPKLAATVETAGVECHLGRRPGWRRRAGESTYESYGTRHHSPARYSVPGRVLIDRSNTFVYHEANLHGCLDLVERAGKPLQEVAWASIGTILTAMQIREAHDRGVLVPWRSWRHEFPKSLRTLHDADRGGVTFSPDVGVHREVHELDFASLYPNVIRTRNVSPERVRCDCHDRADVPGLGYSICDEPGYLPEVLGPLIDDRAGFKEALEATDDPERARRLQGKADAIKWILVSCFGYQGFKNAKFGRIECHEAINAFAREILLDAKERLEAGGWRVVHGIVDSLWVTPRAGESRESLESIAAAVTDDVGIELEHEGTYDWLAFVPRRGDDTGALTRYFGRKSGFSLDRNSWADAHKVRGIACRQRDTPEFVAEVQRDLISALDGALGGEEGPHEEAATAVIDRLRDHLGRLRGGRVDPGELAIETRASKEAGEYDQRTRTVAALERAADLQLDVRPGESVSYVVVDDRTDSRERVRLVCEEPGEYDADFYADRLVRAARDVVAPLGWSREDVRGYLSEYRDATLGAYGG